jgi:hypothetical protein
MASEKKTKKSALSKDSKAENSKAKAPTPAGIKSARDFYFDDLPKTLFPMNTNRILIERGEEEIRKYIAKCLDKGVDNYLFLPQMKAYAGKPNRYLRRTVKLDVVSEFYLYDLIFRNRKLFKAPDTPNRVHYGYRFEGVSPITPTRAYKGFKGAISDYSKRYGHSMGFDVASYFNNIYHHDIVNWFRDIGATDEDAEGIGKLLREINSGRSLDCLPQGLYPTKMIGNDFLRYVDNHFELESEKLVRFMDDFHLFSDREDKLEDDFQSIQRLLGSKGLSVNPRKTVRNSSIHSDIDSGIDAVKAELLAKRRMVIVSGYDEEGDEIRQEVTLRWPLTSREVKYLDDILAMPDIDEDDAELVLTLMRSYAVRVEKRLPYIIENFPHLAKNVYSFGAAVKDKEMLAGFIVDALRGKGRLSEYQLFWFGWMLEEQLIMTSKAPELISLLLGHRSATAISKAKVLEIRDARFGLQETRDVHLHSGAADWLSWASAVGSLALKPASRNQKL